jgi:hypothetical protein
VYQYRRLRLGGGGALRSICVMVAHPQILLLILRVQAFVCRRPDKMFRTVAGLVVHVLFFWLPEFLRLVMMEMALVLQLGKNQLFL